MWYQTPPIELKSLSSSSVAHVWIEERYPSKRASVSGRTDLQRERHYGQIGRSLTRQALFKTFTDTKNLKKIRQKECIAVIIMYRRRHIAVRSDLNNDGPIQRCLDIQYLCGNIQKELNLFSVSRTILILLSNQVSHYLVWVVIWNNNGFES